MSTGTVLFSTKETSFNKVIKHPFTSNMFSKFVHYVTCVLNVAPEVRQIPILNDQLLIALTDGSEVLCLSSSTFPSVFFSVLHWKLSTLLDSYLGLSIEADYRVKLSLHSKLH